MFLKFTPWGFLTFSACPLGYEGRVWSADPRGRGLSGAHLRLCSTGSSLAAKPKSPTFSSMASLMKKFPADQQQAPESSEGPRSQCTDTHMHTHAHTCTHVHTRMLTHIHAHTYTHAHTCTHVHTLAHIHTRAHSHPLWASGQLLTIQATHSPAGLRLDPRGARGSGAKEKGPPPLPSPCPRRTHRA